MQRYDMLDCGYDDSYDVPFVPGCSWGVAPTFVVRYFNKWGGALHEHHSASPANARADVRGLAR
jgi:hypothetical protein